MIAFFLPAWVWVGLVEALIYGFGVALMDLLVTRAGEAQVRWAASRKRKRSRRRRPKNERREEPASHEES